MGVAVVPAGFDRVAAIEAENNGILLRAASGKTARAVVSLDFLTHKV
jgi:hypothetical protein